MFQPDLPKELIQQAQHNEILIRVFDIGVQRLPSVPGLRTMFWHKKF
jgi:hypothetical protein